MGHERSPMRFHLRKVIIIILSVLTLSALLTAMSSVATASDLTTAVERQTDLKGYTLTLLRNREYFQALSERIREARTQIVIAFFLFKTNGHPASYPEIILRELGRAARRGVRVTVVLERDAVPDSTINRDNRDSSERLRNNGVEIHFDSPKKTTHTKLAVIDGRYTFIGSHNLTQAALKHNNELSVLIDSPAVAERTMKYIQEICEETT